MPTTTSKNKLPSINWESYKTKNSDSSDNFSADNVIDAYYDGHKTGLKQKENEFKELFKKNFQLSSSNTEKVVDELKKLGFEAESAYLNIKSISEFEVLIVVKEDDYVSDNFMKIFRYSRAIEKECRENSFYLNFSYATKGENFNIKRVRAEGFKLKHSRFTNA